MGSWPKMEWWRFCVRNEKIMNTASSIQSTIKSYPYKSDNEIKSHFTERLLKRYNILLTDAEYDELHNIKGFTESKILEERPVHWAKISANKSAFIIKIKGKYVFAIYSNFSHKFLTALPWESYQDESRMVPLRLKKLNLKDVAIEKYNEILSVCAKEYVDLGNQTLNFHHYKNNCTYPRLLMVEYKGKLTVGEIYREVVKELKEINENLIANI